MSQYDRQKDDFWDISRLIPQKKKPASPRNTTATPTPVEIETARSVSSDGAWQDAPLTVEINPLSRPGAAAPPCPDDRYSPEHSLVREVRIFRRKGGQGYYEQFCRMAHELYDVTGEEVPFADFFSYVPQYNQMSCEQLAYYFWWRECFQNGTPIKTTQSYLMLYLYEQINLGDLQDPRKGQENMLRLWLAYRKDHPRLGTLAREWICDYSFYHHLPPPELPSSLYRELLGDFRLKEFYIPARGEDDILPYAVLLFCNNYDFTKSKFYTTETKKDFNRVLVGAVHTALDFLRSEGKGLLTGKNGISTMTRDAFAGAICSCRMKCRIEVDYTSFSHTHELRYIITDVLKYAENALRAALGIRSRLSIYAVSTALRARLDAFLPSVLPEKQTRSRASVPAPMPLYERRYEIPTAPVSVERAAEIEAASWQTTRRLVEAFAPETGEESDENALSMPDASAAEETRTVSPSLEEERAGGGVQKEPQESGNTPFVAALGAYRDFVVLALRQDRTAQRAFARERGEMPEAIADKINTVAGDFVGDIILEDRGGVFAVIEDYLDLLKEEGVL